MPKLRTVVIAGLAGAAVEYFYDPRSGNGRRAQMRDQLGGMKRQAGRKIERVKRLGRAEMEGLQQRISHAARGDRPPVDDIELAHKVESNLFARPGFPKGKIDVNVQSGVVYLRGQLESDAQIHDVERAAAKIDGVRGVESLLHRPGRPAPNKLEAIRASSRAAMETNRIGRSG